MSRNSGTLSKLLCACESHLPATTPSKVDIAQASECGLFKLSLSFSEVSYIFYDFLQKLPL